LPSFYFKKETKIALWGWGPGSDEVSQKKPKTTPNMTSPTK